MRKKKEMLLKWNKKLMCMLGFIMVAVFAVGCMEGDYVTYDDATGSAYYEETYNDQYTIDYDDEIKGNSGNKAADIDYFNRR